jgi:hypothetical protein
MTISELVERATSFGGTGNANRASTLPYDVVYIDNTVLAAVHLSEVVGSILISIGTATIAGNHLASNLQRSSTEHLSTARIWKIAAMGTARDPRRRAGRNTLVQHSVPSVSARRSSRTPLKVPVNNIRL